jgi:hypothetical protein
MDFLQRLFFESPVYLAVFSFVLFAVVLFTRRRMNGAAARYSLPGVVLLIVAMFSMQQAVETQRERIFRVLDEFITAIASQNISAAGRAIGEGYNSEEMNRKGIIEFIGSALESIKVYDTRIRQRDVTIDGDRAEMQLAAWATVSIRGGAGEYHMGKWRIGWAVEGGEWKIVSLRPEMIDAIPMEGMGRLRMYVP